MSTQSTAAPRDEALRQAWAAFGTATSHQAYCQRWLEMLCVRLDGVQFGTLLLDSGEAGFTPAAVWPEKQRPDEDITALIEESLEKESGLVHRLAGGGFGIAFPVRQDDRLAALVALSLQVGQDELPVIMERVQWGSAWVELLLRRRLGREQAVQLAHLSDAVELLGAVLAEPDFQGAATSFVNELAQALACDRVSFGELRRGNLQITTLSHSAGFGKKMNLIRQLSGVMQEAIQQRSVVQLAGDQPMDDDAQLVHREHLQFSRAVDNACVLTVPLHTGEDYYGAVTLERPGDLPFTTEEVQRVRSMASLTGEVLRARRAQDRAWYGHLADAAGRQLRRLFGPRYLGRKLLLVGLTGLLVFFTFATGTYRIAADSQLEGAVRRAVVAPFDGYLQAADVRAGDTVKSGQLMSRLDDRDLALERLRSLSEQAKLQRQYQEAVAARNRAEANILQAQIDQTAAQLKLAETKLARTRLTAPFDGVVVSGDLSQRLGAAVEQGEVLFEVAPLDAYRVILWVDEHRMADVAQGQGGELVLNALPEERYPFTVTRVTPVTESRDGGNFFRVEASLDQVTPALRPGMKGVAKIDAGERRLIWIWTYPLLQWLQLKAWAWWP